MPVKILFEENDLKFLIEDLKMTQKNVAKTLSVSGSWVERQCKRLKLKTQPTGPKRGADHPGWKGGKTLTGEYLYIYCPDHPNATKNGYVADHRLMMEKKVGRYLKKTEVVHHLNKDPADNRIENLALFSSNGKHLAKELKGQCPRWSEDGKKKILEATKNRDNSYLSKRKIKVDHARLLELIDEEKLIHHEIAAELGISRDTLRRHCSEMKMDYNWNSRQARIRNPNRREAREARLTCPLTSSQIE